MTRMTRQWQELEIGNNNKIATTEMSDCQLGFFPNLQTSEISTTFIILCWNCTLLDHLAISLWSGDEIWINYILHFLPHAAAYFSKSNEIIFCFSFQQVPIFVIFHTWRKHQRASKRDLESTIFWKQFCTISPQGEICLKSDFKWYD